MSICLDTVYNLPRTLLRWRQHRWLVLEVGIDHRREMEFHLDLIKPTVVVFMGITPVHAQQQLLGSKEGIFAEKNKLIQGLGRRGLLIYNADDVFARRAAKLYRGQKLGFSLNKGKGQYYLQSFHVSLRGTKFFLRSRLSGRKLELETKLLGKHFAQSFLAAFALAEARHLSLRDLRLTAKQLKPLPGRLSLQPFLNGSLLLDDRLRSNPASARAGLNLLSSLKVEVRRLIVVMGEMGELGHYAVEEHRRLGKQINRLRPDVFLAIGPLMRLAAQQAGKGNKKTKIILASDPVGAAMAFKEKVKIKKGDLFYIKGSLLRHLERFLYVLQGQKVRCRKVVCHRYPPCDQCPFCCP